MSSFYMPSTRAVVLDTTENERTSRAILFTDISCSVHSALTRAWDSGLESSTPYLTMKRYLPLFAMALLAITLAPFAAHAVTPLKDDIPAPHFEIMGELGSAEAASASLPLKSTQVRTRISGVIAQVEMTQTYANTGSVPLDATYVFPGSTRAAIHGMEIKVGDRTIKAQIQERGKARQTYETAKAQKKTATLLEQQRPNVFEMNVANIAVGAEVQVRLTYSELLVPTDAVYEFVLPGVVGPRYTSSRSGDTALATNPFLAEGTANPASLDFELMLDAGLPVKSLTSPSHALDIQFTSATSALARLKASPTDPSNRDLIVRYQLADQKVNTGLLLHRGDDGENFFLLNVQPPERVTKADITPREYLFIVDISGSMNGFPLETAKQLMRNLLGTLREKDHFNLLLFAGSNEVLSELPLQATRHNIASAMTMINESRSGGGTELLPALQRALSMQGEDDRSRSIVIITDGYITVEKQAFDLIRRNLGQANVFTFGIGSSVNRHLLEGLASIGNGEPFVVTQIAECPIACQRFQRYVTSPLLTNIRVRAEGFDAFELEPGSVPDLFADRPLTIVGKWKGAPRGKITVTGRTAKGPYEATIDVPASEMTNPALRPLWAREKARVLGDYARLDDTEAKAQLTALGLNYSLLTEQTSFVATDDQPQTFAVAATHVRQPVPLPQGVGSGAVSPSVTQTGGAGTVPEPGVMSLLLFTLTVLVMMRRRPAAHGYEG